MASHLGASGEAWSTTGFEEFPALASQRLFASYGQGEAGSSSSSGGSGCKRYSPRVARCPESGAEATKWSSGSPEGRAAAIGAAGCTLGVCLICLLAVTLQGKPGPRLVEQPDDQGRRMIRHPVTSRRCRPGGAPGCISGPSQMIPWLTQTLRQQSQSRFAELEQLRRELRDVRLKHEHWTESLGRNASYSHLEAQRLVLTLTEIEQRLRPTEMSNEATESSTTSTLTTTFSISAFPPGPARACDCSSCAGTCTHGPPEPPPPPDPRRYAFVMMAYDEPGKQEHLLAVLPIAQALRRLSSFPLVLLTNTTAFSDGTPVAGSMRRLNVQVLPVYKVELPSSLKKGLMFKRWEIAYWKLQIWKLTQYEKIIWMDSDSIISRSIDWLFERPWMWAQRDDWFCKKGAAQAVCSGLMLLYPNEEDFHGLLKYAETAEAKHGDQELISKYFAEVRKKPISLLNDLEAAFGQCIGSADAPFPGIVGGGSWNTPAFVHKSGGWGNTNENVYINQCFSHIVARQYYKIGSSIINVCHYHPLGAYWRSLFCDATTSLGVHSDAIDAYCSDECWYRGQHDGGKLCRPVNASICASDLSTSAASGKPGSWKSVPGFPLIELQKKRSKL